MRLILLFLVFSSACLSQQGDSTLADMRGLSDDTTKVCLLYKRGFSLRNTDPALASLYSELCSSTAANVGMPYYVAKSLNLKGILLFKKGNLTEAIVAHEKALKIRTEIEDVSGSAISLINLGNVYSAAGALQKAGNKYLEALNLFQKINDKKNIANCLVNLGVVNQSQQQVKEAEQNYLLAYKIAGELNDYEIKCLCLNNLAQVYYDQGNYEKSIAYNNDVLKLRTLMDNNVETADSYLNLASNYIKLHEFKTAKTSVDTAFSIASRYGYFEGLQTAYQVYSDYYSEKKEFEEAYMWLRKFQKSRDSVSSLTELNTISCPSDPDKKNLSGSLTLNNLWLLISVFFLLIFVPLFLVKFNR